MKQRASVLKITSHLFLAAVIYLAISLIPVAHSWIKATLFLVWGIYVFIDVLKLILFGTRRSLSGAYILFYVGCLVLAISFLWLGNLALKTVLNPFFAFLDWEFRMGNLFSGIYQYVFSVPGIIAGIALIIAGLLWENEAQYRKWYEALFPGTRKPMFKREF